VVTVEMDREEVWEEEAISREFMEELVSDGYCEWKEDRDGIWHTSCNQTFFFDSGDAIDNGFLYCPFCGRRLLQLNE